MHNRLDRAVIAFVYSCLVVGGLFFLYLIYAALRGMQ